MRQPYPNYVANAFILLQAARGLRSPFTLEELVIAAWKLSAERFSLRGFPQYPDANKVGLLVTHKRDGLVGRGYAVKVRPKTYTLTRKAAGAQYQNVK